MKRNNRRINLFNKLDKSDLRGIITDSSHSIFYLLGFDIPGIVVSFVDGKILLSAPEMLKKQAEMSVSDSFPFSFIPIAEVVDKLKRKKTGIDISSSLGLYRVLMKQKPVFSRAIAELRMIKDEDEINAVRKTALLTVDFYKKFEKKIDGFKYESDCYNRICAEILLMGNTEISFRPIIAGKRNSSYPHYDCCPAGGMGKRRKLGKENIMLDFGLKYKGYCSDITRMYNVRGGTKVHLERLNEARKLVMDFIRPGRSCSEIDEFAVKELTKQGYKNNILHSTGHGIGLEVHEAPALSVRDKTVIQPGMIMTVEPGIYFEGDFGLRVEEMLVVGENKNEILTMNY